MDLQYFFSDWYNEEVLFKKGKFSLFTQREMQLSKFKRLIVRYLWFENIWGQYIILLLRYDSYEKTNK